MNDAERWQTETAIKWQKRAVQARAELAEARERLAAVEALAEHWRDEPHSLLGIRNAAECVAHDLRAALGDAAGTLAKVRAEALREAAAELRRMMDGYPKRGAHTRAGWAVAMLKILADRIEAGHERVTHQ